MAERSTNPTIGIDLGTTNSCVGVLRNNKVEIIANDQENRTTPSSVAFKETERLVGDAAKNEATSNPTNTVFGGITDVIIPRNTPVPTQKSEVYDVTITDFQSRFFIIRVYEGERTQSKDNLLGQFILSGIHYAPRGETKMKLFFKIDSNGNLHVSFGELVSGSKKQITLINNREARLSKQEIVTMVQEAARYRMVDEEYTKKVLAKKSLEVYAYSLRKLVKDNKVVSKVPSGYVDKVIKWLKHDVLKDASEYDTKKKELEEMSSSLSKMSQHGPIFGEGEKTTIEETSHIPAGHASFTSPLTQNTAIDLLTSGIAGSSGSVSKRQRTKREKTGVSKRDLYSIALNREKRSVHFKQAAIRESKRVKQQRAKEVRAGSAAVEQEGGTKRSVRLIDKAQENVSQLDTGGSSSKGPLEVKVKEEVQDSMPEDMDCIEVYKEFPLVVIDAD